MNRKDVWLGAACGAAALWALWPSWLDARMMPANFGDLCAYHYPMRHLVVEALQQGRLPFWNPYIFCGLPLAANPQSALFYPASVLGFALPLAFAFSWDQLLHLAWAMLGVALLARRGGVPAAAGWTLALLYALSPFVVYRITEGIPTLLASLAWVPWCWLAWSSGRPGWLGAVWALQLLSGHPQFLVVNAAGMGLWSLASRMPFARLSELGREALWSLGLAAAQWLPTWEFIGLSVRRSWPAAFSLAYSLTPEDLKSLLWPGALGDPLAGTYAGPPSVFFETHALWIGAVGLAAAALGLRARRRCLGAAALAAAGTLLALGAHGPLYHGAFGAALSLLRTPSRWLLLSLWGLILLAAAGLAWAGRRGGRWAAAFLFAASAFELMSWDSRFLGARRAAEFLAPNPMFARAVGGAASRLITDPGLANPNKAALYHARNANGYEAFYLDGYPQYAARSEGAPAADASRMYLSKFTPELDRLGVAWRLTPEGGLESSRSALPLAYFTAADGARVGADPRLELETPERWRVAGTWPAQARRLILAQPLYPGWSARLDGSPVELRLWDGLLQAVDAPAERGAFSLDLRYAPTGWPLWAAITILCWAHWLLRQRQAW